MNGSSSSREPRSSADHFLAEALEIAKVVRQDLRGKEHPRLNDLPPASREKLLMRANRLSVLVRALDNWLRGGNGLESFPKRWRPRIEIKGPKR